MKIHLIVVIILTTLIVMCISSHRTELRELQFSPTANAKRLFEASWENNTANESISLSIIFDGWNATIKGTQEIELSLSSSSVIPFLFENSSILRFDLEKIEVYGAKVSVKAFYDGKYGVLLLNVTPTRSTQKIRLFYTSHYQPLLDINMRDPIEWHMKSTKDYFYIPPEAYMFLSKLRGKFTIKVLHYSTDYTLAGILKLRNGKYKPLLPEEDAFHTDGKRLYILLGRWYIYESTIKIYDRNIKVIALTDEGNVTNALSKILKVYSSHLIPYPYDELIYIRFKGHRSEYEGYGLYGGALGTQFKRVIPHEVAHNWFAMYADLGILNEPFAVYTSSLYNLTSEQVDKWEGLCLSLKDKTPIARINGITRQNMNTLYQRGGFILRSLQFVVGNETFFKGLRELLGICHAKECTKTEETLNLIKEIYENLTNKDLDWFFKEWFYTADYPNFTVSSLKVIQNGNYYRLILNITEKNGFAMPLEVKIVTPTENITKRIFVNGSAILGVELKEKPLRVIIDPNDWMINADGSNYRVNWENFMLEKIEKEAMELNGVEIVVN
ncbi:M1 family aminopeptidase [Thermococcus barophilus]|uniref:Aminopeptidase N n=1 Tax=Thermococcus barophilus TaxID=55802 RepID=A0A0S1XD92_THEBA|nr:M1 family aminopeptidase [Thermococcus barophilus]ALM75757.1 aminopeptidase N [Thermococcus barophilus]